MMASKQPSSPSFSRTVAAWFLSELVKICTRGQQSVSDSNPDAMELLSCLCWHRTAGFKINSQSSSVAERAAAALGQGRASASHTAGFHERKRGSHHRRNHSPKPTTS
jgi:hypothetical protein